MKTFAFASISALLLAACVINDDDGNADTSGNSQSSSQSASTTNTSTTVGTEESSGAGTSASTTVSSSSESSADSTAADSSSGGGGACGWGATGEKTTPMGYICGGDGPDPDGMIDMACPEAIELVEGGDCGGDMGITGAGCCDANGDVWFCGDDAGMPRLFTEDC